MVGLTFTHFSEGQNAGDIASGPYHYFDFGPHEVIDIRRDVPREGVVVYGGGAVAHKVKPADVVIVWGAGFTRHGKTTPGPAPKGALVGLRDLGAGEYVPCPSCMSPLFDADHEPTREAVAVLNADPRIKRKYPVRVRVPVIENNRPMAEIVAHIGSAERVVTNSYHGAYWATLMGRKVELVGAYSSKFHGFRFPPGRAWPQALAMDRAVTLGFAARVRELLCR
jgi:hypothetical protein